MSRNHKRAKDAYKKESGTPAQFANCYRIAQRYLENGNSARHAEIMEKIAWKVRFSADKPTKGQLQAIIEQYNADFPMEVALYQGQARLTREQAKFQTLKAKFEGHGEVKNVSKLAELAQTEMTGKVAEEVTV